MVCMRTLHSGPDQIIPSPHQTFAQPLTFRRNRDRLQMCLAQKSRREHLSTLVHEGCSAHSRRCFDILCSEREEASMSSRQGLGGFYNLFLCPVLRWTYLCKYISYLSAVDDEPWGALIAWDALPCLAKHGLLKAMSVSINILEMLNGASLRRLFPPPAPYNHIFLANFHSKE